MAGENKPGGPTRRGNEISPPADRKSVSGHNRRSEHPKIRAEVTPAEVPRETPGTVRCFWLEPIDRMRRALRCYVSGSECPASGMGYHDAVSDSREVPLRGLDDEGYHRAPPQRRHRADPSWPTVCACGYNMAGDPDLQRQVIEDQLYETDDGRRFTITYRGETDAPDGAMWDAWWLHRIRTGPDGMSLTVRCPRRQDWHVDLAASSGGGYWTRTGDPRDPPSLSVSPSIAIGFAASRVFYHGFLTNGVLLPQGDSRAIPG